MQKLKINKKKNESNILVDNLSKLLDSHQISEYDLAKNLNIPYNTINRIMTGLTTDPRISTLEQIANYFGVKLDFLLHNTRDQNFNDVDIPVVDWDLIAEPHFLKKIDRNQYKRWIPVGQLLDETICLNEIFAIESTKSMGAKFPLGTILIIQPGERPIDGDLVLVRFKIDNSVSLRELIIDSPNWQLNPIIPGSTTLLFNHSDHTIVGIVALTLRQTRSVNKNEN